MLMRNPDGREKASSIVSKPSRSSRARRIEPGVDADEDGGGSRCGGPYDVVSRCSRTPSVSGSSKLARRESKSSGSMDFARGAVISFVRGACKSVTRAGRRSASRVSRSTGKSVSARRSTWRTVRRLGVGSSWMVSMAAVCAVSRSRRMRS